MSARIAPNIGIALLSIGMVLASISIATPYWMQSTTKSYVDHHWGLWKYCIREGTIDKKESCVYLTWGNTKVPGMYTY